MSRRRRKIVVMASFPVFVFVFAFPAGFLPENSKWLLPYALAGIPAGIWYCVRAMEWIDKGDRGTK